MEENGIIIYEDGSYQSFGKYLCPDEKGYDKNPGHEQSFKEEIVPSFRFKMSRHDYYTNNTLYSNALKLSLDGVIMIFNNRQTTKLPTELLAYVPDIPTEEQLKTLESLEQIKNSKVQKVYSFSSYDFDDYIEYKNFNDYIELKKEKSK